jgi:hypothetical protein
MPTEQKGCCRGSEGCQDQLLIPKAIYMSNHNKLFTKGIKISCTKKKELYSLYRNNKDNIQVRDHYKKYCNVLKRVINEAKKQYFHNQIATF